MALVHLLFVILLPSSTLVQGHGNMVKPYAWWDTQKIGWWFDENGDRSYVGCGNLDLPATEFEEVKAKKPDCQEMWFTGGAVLPEDQEPTLPEYMSQPEVKCIGQSGENDTEAQATFPWSAPGAAPVMSPCGTMGGKGGPCDPGVT